MKDERRAVPVNGIFGRLVAPVRLALAVLAISLLGTSQGFAAFHLMTIQEIFAGPPSDGNYGATPLTADQRGQYIMLRMTGQGQNFTNGTALRVEDADGNLLGKCVGGSNPGSSCTMDADCIGGGICQSNFGSFTANVGSGGAAGCAYPNCPAVLMGTQNARNLFTIALTFDKLVNGQANRVALPLSGGRVCFVSGSSVVDCVAWGNFDCTRSGNCAGANTIRTGDFTANGCDTDYGTPAPALQLGFVLRHSTGAFNCAVKDNATNYSLQYPHPVNNGGTNNNTDTDMDGLVDQLDCNDMNFSIRWPAAEVRNETVTGKSPSTISWDSQASTAGTGVTYDVLCGQIAHVSGFTDASCLTPNTAGTSTTDAVAPVACAVAPGGGVYFLERAGSGAGCLGTYGTGGNPPVSRDTALGAICP